MRETLSHSQCKIGPTNRAIEQCRGAKVFGVQRWQKKTKVAILRSKISIMSGVDLIQSALPAGLKVNARRHGREKEGGGGGGERETRRTFPYFYRFRNKIPFYLFVNTWGGKQQQLQDSSKDLAKLAADMRDRIEKSDDKKKCLEEVKTVPT